MIAIVPAAGAGRRMGPGVTKTYRHLGDRPVLAHTLACLEECGLIYGILVLVRPEDRTYCQELVQTYGLRKVKEILSGGEERQDSVWKGLEALAIDPPTWVMVHDGVRPFLTHQMIDEVYQGAQEWGAAIAAVPVKDTIKEVHQGQVIKTLPRSQLWAVQTPQIFRYPLLHQAYQQALTQGWQGTDDASLVERAGGRVRVVMGSYENIKVTTPEDLSFGEAIRRGREHHE